MNDLIRWLTEPNWLSWLLCGLMFGFAIGHDYTLRKIRKEGDAKDE